MKILLTLFSLIVLISPNLVLAQNSTIEGNLGEKIIFQKLNLDKGNSKFTVKGTSTIHDWEMISESFNGSISINQSNSENVVIKDIAITVGVKSLESGNSMMDNKCHDALKVDKNPNIIYQFKGLKSIKSLGNSKYSAILSGTLNIAGKTELVDINTTLTKKGNGIQIEGEKPIKMSDFDVKPPVALLGTIKTGNDITIVINITYL